jgi:hypothetical protein
MNTSHEVANEICRPSKLGLCVAAWAVIIALLLFAGRAGDLVTGAALFGVSTPLEGALAMFLQGGSEHSAVASIPMVSGWLYYIVLTLLALRAKRRLVFFSLYAILCLNVLLSGFFTQTMVHFQ